MLCLFLFKVFAPFRLIAAVKIGLLFIPSKFSAAIRGKKDNKCGIHDNQAWIWKAQPHGRNKSVFMKPSSSAESCVQKFCKAFPGRNHACKNFARRFPDGIIFAKILQGVSRTESCVQKFCKAFPGRNHVCKNFAGRFPDGIMCAKFCKAFPQAGHIFGAQMVDIPIFVRTFATDLLILSPKLGIRITRIWTHWTKQT